jgi:hypothetical protein
MKDKLFIKNFYYNRASLLKLVYLYNYLTQAPFVGELGALIASNKFSIDERKTEVLLEIYEKLIPKVTVLDLSFGFVRIYEERVIFYFKNDCNFDDFFIFFSNLENDYEIKWGCIEFFDKDIKIAEIFSKNALLRDFRNEVVSLNKKNQVKNFKEIPFNPKKENFLLFLKQYDTKNIKLILYFFKIED